MASSDRVTVDDIKEEIGATDAQVELRCSVEHINRIAPSIQNVSSFASHINMPPAVLRGIETDQTLDAVQKTAAVLKWWRANMRNATYKRFIEIWIELGDGDLAREMCALCGTASNPIPTESIKSNLSKKISKESSFNKSFGSLSLGDSFEQIAGRLPSFSSYDIPPPSPSKPRSDSTSTASLLGADALQKLSSWDRSDIPAPDDLLRPIDAVAYGDVAFFRNCFTRNIYMYNKAKQVWCQLPNCLVADTSLVVLPVTYRGDTIFRLHTVGGRKLKKDRQNGHDEFTGVLYQIQEIDGRSQWEKHPDYPDMKFKRAQVTVTYSDSYQCVIAAGGCNDNGVIRKVEVLDTSASHKEWSKVATLLQPVFRASACICNGFLYILGGNVCNPEGYLIPTKEAYKASIEQLIDSTAGDTNVFTSIKPLPLNESACVVFRDNLLAIGGWVFDGDRSTGTKLVYVYDKVSKKWNKFRTSNEPRSQHFAAAFDDSILIVGGYENPCGLRTNSVEIATLSTS